MIDFELYIFFYHLTINFAFHTLVREGQTLNQNDFQLLIRFYGHVLNFRSREYQDLVAFNWLKKLKLQLSFTILPQLRGNIATR